MEGEMKTRLIRRDLCGLVGERAAKLTPRQAAEAWSWLAAHVEDLCAKDVPKFHDLIKAIRDATIQGKKFERMRKEAE